MLLTVRLCLGNTLYTYSLICDHAPPPRPSRNSDDSSSFIGTTSSTSSSSTVPGPGAITGKFLKLLGEKSLDLVVFLIILNRLRAIECTLEKSPQVFRNPTGDKEQKRLNDAYAKLREICLEVRSDYYPLSFQRAAAKLIRDITIMRRPGEQSSTIDALLVDVQHLLPPQALEPRDRTPKVVVPGEGDVGKSTPVKQIQDASMHDAETYQDAIIKDTIPTTPRPPNGEQPAWYSIQPRSSIKHPRSYFRKSFKSGATSQLQLYQEQLRISTKDSHQYHALERNLYQMLKKFGDLPPYTDLRAGVVQRVGKSAVAGSEAFDIWEGIWLGQEKVALKMVRGLHVSLDTHKRFQKVAKIWRKLRQLDPGISTFEQRFQTEVKIWRKVWQLDPGRYILPFYGACFEDGPYPYIVSPWMVNGDVMQYLAKHPRAKRTMFQIKCIAKGLSILHNLKPKPIAHGDVKVLTQANVLIDDRGQPLLADFGLSKILEDVDGVPFARSEVLSDSCRWFAPELCSAPGVISMQSDVYAYSMTVVEIMTGQQPFSHIRRTTEVLIEVQKGQRPIRPTDPTVRERGLDDHLWDLLTQCWEADPARRPSMDQILTQL